MNFDRNEKYNIEVEWTIERQLEIYTRHDAHNERHEILWHAWNQNKRWLSQLLELTLASFPTYSRHNEVHAKTIIHNIEKILGEKRIRELSPTDCFLLLHTAYVHDIGMCVTAIDKEDMLNSDEFVYMIEELLEKSS